MADVYYQIALIDAAGMGFASTLRQKLEEAIRDRGLDPDETFAFFVDQDASKMLGNGPQIAVYFGGAGFDPQYDDVIAQLLSVGTAVIPVVESLVGFHSKVPKSLQPINGMAVGSADDLDALAALVLEELRLLRAKRSLFISYKRTDSEAAALQLYRHFDDRFFQAFLDTHSIRQGADFQERLWHRMADCEVVVLLYTPNLLESEWVRQELGRASLMGIRVLQLIWPGMVRDRRTEMLEPFYLAESDFLGVGPITHESQLTEDVQKRISASVERLRARSMAAREARLLRPLCKLAADQSIPYAIRHAGSVDLHTDPAKAIRVCIGLGVPDATTFHDAVEPAVLPQPTKTFVLYDPIGIASFHQHFLDWFFPICPVGGLTPDTLPSWISSL